MSETPVNPLADLDTEALYMARHPRTGESLPVDHPAVQAARAKVEAYYASQFDTSVDIPEAKRQAGVARTLNRAQESYEMSDAFEAETGHRKLTLQEFAESESPARPDHHAMAKEIVTLTTSPAYLDVRNPQHSVAIKRAEWLFQTMYNGAYEPGNLDPSQGE